MSPDGQDTVFPPGASKAVRTMILVGAIAIGGCSGIRTKTPEGESVTMNEAEFAAYVEHVFRHHNNVVNDLMFVSNTADENKDTSDLVGAEARMDHACLPLNELVSSLSGGQRPTFRTKTQLLKAVPECEAATRKVETLIPHGIVNQPQHPPTAMGR
jgi:hypothetical protein